MQIHEEGAAEIEDHGRGGAEEELEDQGHGHVLVSHVSFLEIHTQPVRAGVRPSGIPVGWMRLLTSLDCSTQP